MDVGSIALLAFSVAFMLLAIFRIVEFGDVGLPTTLRRVLITLHLLGSACFAAAMAVFALDPTQEHKRLLHALFSAGILTLFPIHIYVALKRRIKIRERLGR